MFYYCIFFLSSFFMEIASFFSKKNNKLLKILFVILGILILAIVSGIRDYSIGTDTLNYNLVYNYAHNSVNIIQYCNSLKHVNGTEYGFSILSYLVAKVGLNPHGFYFICQLLIAINVYLALDKMSENLSVTLGWMTYCFMFYTSSFNILRQMIALSFILLGIAYLYKNKMIKAMVLLGLACLFHTSSIIGVFIFLTGYCVLKIKSKKKLVLAISIIVIMIILLPNIIGFLNLNGAFSDKYSEYMVEGVKVPILITVSSRLPLIICMFLSILKNRGTIKRQDIYIYLLIVFELIMLPLQNISPAVARLLLCFGISKIVGYPLIINNIKTNYAFINVIEKSLFIIYLGLVFYLQVLMNNNGMVYPYIVANY